MRIDRQAPRHGADGTYPVVVVYERPSLLSRLLVILSTVVVTVFAIWILAPIILTNDRSSFAAIPLLSDVIPSLREFIAADGAPAQQSASAPEPPADDSRGSRDLVVAPEPAPERPQPVEADATPAAEPQQSPALASTSTAPAFVSLDTPIVPAQPTSLIPWPDAVPSSPAPQEEPSAVEETTASVESGSLVPMPRKRPSAAAMARLVVPVPRPRPEDAPTAAEAPPENENLLFDRLSQPN